MNMEDKQKICKLLLPAIRATRYNENLIDLIYETHDFKTKTVTAIFSSGFTREIDVSYDTGIEMIRKIVNTFW